MGSRQGPPRGHYVMALALADADVGDIRDLHRLTRLAGGLARTVDDADYPQIRAALPADR